MTPVLLGWLAVVVPLVLAALLTNDCHCPTCEPQEDECQP